MLEEYKSCVRPNPNSCLLEFRLTQTHLYCEWSLILQCIIQRLLLFNEADVLKLLFKLYRASTEENICKNTEHINEWQSHRCKLEVSRHMSPHHKTIKNKIPFIYILTNAYNFIFRYFIFNSFTQYVCECLWKFSETRYDGLNSMPFRKGL